MKRPELNLSRLNLSRLHVSRLNLPTVHLPGGARLRERLQHVDSLARLREIAEEHSSAHNECA